jgi:DNA polymerase III epsilon subunit-like protein
MINYIGLDGEMSGTDINNGHKLIQIGLAKIVDGEMISTSALLNPGEMAWSEEAEQIHQFSRETIAKDGLTPYLVDENLADWVSKKVDKQRTIVVGFNVGSFDLPFVAQTLPVLKNRLSRRSVDLNSIIFSMANTDNQFQKIKRRAKDYALEQMDGMFDGFKNRQHDAEFDAVMALYCFEYLRRFIRQP